MRAFFTNFFILSQRCDALVDYRSSVLLKFKPIIVTFIPHITSVNIDNKEPYSIPEDNPFINGMAPEIWAYGLRNPYRFNFDVETGSLVCVDVGDRLKEEVNIIKKGRNYGWPIYEGSNLTENQSSDSIDGKHILPAIEYDHKPGWGQAIIGSFIYRGNIYPDFQDKVLIADWNGDMFLANDFENKILTPIILDNIVYLKLPLGNLNYFSRAFPSIEYFNRFNRIL